MSSDPKNLGQWTFKRAGDRYVKAWHLCYLESKYTSARIVSDQFICRKCGATITRLQAARHTQSLSGEMPID